MIASLLAQIQRDSLALDRAHENGTIQACVSDLAELAQQEADDALSRYEKRNRSGDDSEGDSPAKDSEPPGS